MSGKHKSRYYGQKSDSKSGGSSSKSGPTILPASFLFICNELHTNDNPEEAGSVSPRYVDGRWRPPRVTDGFKTQKAGWVYRWTNGDITTATDYAWNENYKIHGIANGRIYNVHNGLFPHYYRAATVFFCNRFDLFFTSRVDATIVNIADAAIEDDWHPLTFNHEQNISRLEHIGSEPHLDVRAAPWIGQLLPNTYRRHSSSHDERHLGLGGLLSIATSLVAFTCTSRTDLNDALIRERAWISGHWRGHRRPGGHIGGRGFVSTIYLDPENPGSSTPDTLFDLEYGGTSLFR